MMQTLGLSPTPVSPPPNGQRVRRSLEDIVTKAVAPGDPGLTDLVLTEHISIAAVTLLSELAREFRVNAPLGTTIDIDTTLTYVLQALQELHPVAGDQTVEQLEAAAAKRALFNETPAFRPPAATPPPPPAATFEDMLVQAIKPASATSLATIASQSQVKVLDAISRAAHNTLPSGSRWWSDDEYWTHMRKACIAELDKLAPGYTAPSLAQLAAAADRLAQPPPPNPSHSTQRTQGAMLYDGLTTGDMQHLMTYDTQLQGVIGSALQFNGDDSDGKHERPVTARNAIPAQVPFKVSPTLYKRTSESEFLFWISHKWIKYRNIAAKVFGKLGNGLGADCPDLMECLKDVHSYFQDDRVLMEHVYALGRVYKLEVANYRSLVAKLDWDAGPHMFPPEQFDNAWLIHLEYCTSFLTSVQRTGTRTWGDFYIILYADYSEWADLPPTSIETVMCALKARNIGTTPISYTGKTPPVTVPRPIEIGATPPAAVDKPLTADKKAPTGNIAVAGVTTLTWAEVKDRKLCANCYAATHAAPACTLPCRKKVCHPPHLTRFDGHHRKDCKAK